MLKFFLFILICNLTCAQEKAIFVFSNSKQPVQDVAFHIDDTIKYVSNKFGYVNVRKKDLLKLVKIKHVSYQEFEINNLISTDTIFLKERVELLNEVLLVEENKKAVTKIIFPPNSFLSEFGHYKGWATTFEAKYATYIPFEEEVNAKIKSIRIELKKDHFLTKNILNMPFKVNLFSVDSVNKVPDKKLIDESIFVQKDKNNNIEIDVIDYDIDFPSNGVFVVVEILSVDYYVSKGFKYNKGPSFKYLEKLKDEDYFTLRKLKEKGNWEKIKDFIYKFGIEILK